MKIDFYNVPEDLIDKLQSFHLNKKVKIMEVCGTHTVSIHKYGIHKLLPDNVTLVSGPGCPVCVTPAYYIDQASYLAAQGYSIVTFGDLFKVPGVTSSLEIERSKGRDIRMVYSPYDTIKIAENLNNNVVFLAVGFETTIPGIAVTVKKVKELRLNNLKFLFACKIIEPAMKVLIEDTDIDGFLLPGHVSTVTGIQGYSYLKEKGIPGVIAGFEPLDIITSIIELLGLIKENKYDIINNYPRAVRDNGNPIARKLIEKTFNRVDAEWRGLGFIEESGLELNDNYCDFDIANEISVEVERAKDISGCRCGEVLKGLINPPQCELFKDVCTPENPLGPCMVSSEGSCSAWFWFG